MYRFVPAALLLTSFTTCQKQAPQKAKQDSGPVAVSTAPVTTRQLARSVDSVGTLFPFDEVIVSAEIEGRVDKVNFDLGDTVRQGDALVNISDEEQRYILAQNEAQLRQSLERLGLKAENDKVKDIEETPEVRRSRADLMEAQKRFERIRTLVDQKIGAQADLDAASTRYQAMLAALDLTRNQTRNLIQEVERFKAVVELQRKKLRDTTVRAPFGAMVKERQVTAGQYVRPNTPLFNLVKINPVRLRLEVPERMAPWTKVGQTADVSVEAFENRRFVGRVSRIAPTVDQTKRTFVVEALIDNPDGALKPGSYARARLATQRVDQVLLAPARAINYVLGANRAYVVDGSGTIEAREVKTGDRYEQQLEIISGLKEGEQVATTQLNRLDTGVKVRPTREQASQASQKSE
ncbi:MAG: efflux RND transporter periplasmic adaptor subunit [Acidobacteria bacterium]|nr:efflux RND transporter periplasmic adaptor subunit [Acidobacteriota bacterium]